MSQESVIKAKEEAKRRKIEGEKAVAKPPIEKEGEIEVARVEKKPTEVSVPLKRERKTGFGLFSFQRIKTSTLASALRIKLLPIFMVKIGPLQLLKLKALSIAKSPKFQLHRPSAIKVQTLEPIKVRSFQTSCPIFYMAKPTKIRTQILKPIKAEVPLQTLTPELSILLSLTMKLPFPKLFKVKLSKLVQSPQLKFSPTKTPAPIRIPLKGAPKVKSMLISITPTEVKPVTAPIEEVKAVPEVKAEEIAPTEVEAKKIIDDLFYPVKGSSCFKWKLNRPLCIVLAGEKYDGVKMIEDLISTKYTFHGFYKFSRNLPWQKEIMEPAIAPKILERKKLSIHDLILSDDLVVSATVQKEDKDEIVKGLRDVSDRGAKCVILYTENVGPFEHLDSEVARVDIKFVNLPKLNSKTLEYVGELLGVDLEILERSVDYVWHSAIRLYEEEAEYLDKRLSDKEVSYYPKRETFSHYLMKKVIYYYLKRKYPNKNVKVEEPIFHFDERGEITKIIPDITLNGEYWEVETGYPSKDEENLITEPFNPRARLIWKLEKYGEECQRVNVVVPSVYAYLFREEIKKVKEYFKDKIVLKFYTLRWYKEVQCKFFC